MSASTRATKALEQAGVCVAAFGPRGIHEEVGRCAGGQGCCHDAAVLEHALVYLNGGQHGLQVRMNPREIVRVLGAVVVCVVACVVAGD